MELRRKWSYAFARKKAWLPRLAIAGMLTAAGTVLFLLFLPLHGTHIDDEAKHNSLRLRYRLTQLYDNLGLDGKELTERYMLTGLISDAINTGKSPREERTVRYMELVEREDELFVARVLTESLAASFQYLEIRGTVDNYMCGIILSNVTELDLSYYAGKRLGGCAASTRCIDGVHVNNGSKGELTCTCMYACTCRSTCTCTCLAPPLQLLFIMSSLSLNSRPFPLRVLIVRGQMFSPPHN